MNERTGCPRSAIPAGNVLVVGAGTMGSGIAQAFAAAEWRVILADLAEDQVATALERIDSAWQRDVEKGRCDDRDLVRRRSLLSGTTSYDADASDADLIVEAIIEDLDAKSGLFRQLSASARASCVLASNTSSISIDSLAGAASGPERVIGLHFFNPAPVNPLVEIVRGERTAPETVERCQAIVEQLGKTPVVVRNTPGFVANRILLPMINEAVHCLEDDVAGASEIDAVMKLGMKHPIGPLALADLIGLDVCVQILNVLHHDLQDAKYQPAKLLRQMVKEGRMGRKSGRGFFDYPQ